MGASAPALDMIEHAGNLGPVVSRPSCSPAPMTRRRTCLSTAPADSRVRCRPPPHPSRSQSAQRTQCLGWKQFSKNAAQRPLSRSVALLQGEKLRVTHQNRALGQPGTRSRAQEQILGRRGTQGRQPRVHSVKLGFRQNPVIDGRSRQGQARDLAQPMSAAFANRFAPTCQTASAAG